MTATRSYNGSRNLVDQGVYSATLPDGTVVSVPVLYQIQQQITSGNTGPNQENRFWRSIGRVLSSGASDNFPLNSFGGIDIGMGAGNDELGLPAGFNSVTRIIVFSYPTSTGTLVIGNDGSGAEWTSPRGAAGVIEELNACGVWDPLEDGTSAWTVTASTNCNLKLLASGGNCAYDILIWGRF